MTVSPFLSVIFLLLLLNRGPLIVTIIRLRRIQPILHVTFRLGRAVGYVIIVAANDLGAVVGVAAVVVVIVVVVVVVFLVLDDLGALGDGGEAGDEAVDPSDDGGPVSVRGQLGEEAGFSAR